MRKVLVTSGGTREYIDDVRVMTNISTGRLGAKIADRLAPHFDVQYVYGYGAVMPDLCRNAHAVTSVESLKTCMESYLKSGQIAAVVHCMAVSDFSFNRQSHVKCKSDSAEDFIEYMRSTIVRTPKIISMIKQWSPNTILIGFKFEVGVSYDDLKALAMKSIRNNGCDLVVANDKEEMVSTGTHVAHLFFSESMIGRGYQNRTVMGKEAIAEHIGNFLGDVC